MFGMQEWMLIVLVVLVLFGASAIPKIAKSLGQAKSEFQKGLQNKDEDESEKKTDLKKAKK